MTSQPNQEGSSFSAIPEKLPENLKLKQGRYARFHRLQRDKEGKTSSRIPDRASEEGYNWRKYGQKLVKGNEFIRSYYRCTHPNCQAKKQVERLQDGKITDTIYRGQHEHPKPQSSPPTSVGVVLPIQAKIPDEASLAIGEDTSSIAHPTSHQDEPTSSTIAPTDSAVEGVISQSDRTRDAVDGCGDQELKRPKKDSCDIDETPMETPNGEQNVVVHTTSEGDVVNDGYRWRKYGQKLVKGNPNPRSYYRCSTAGCPVKKHVERASDDPKVIIITYGGQHDHDMPPVRTVTTNTAGACTSITARNGESSSRPEKGSEVGLQVVVHTSAS